MTATHEVYGRHLRYALTITLTDAARPLTVRELIDSVERAGFTIPDRPSKTVSDALRWEVRRGRVARVGRGTYEARPFPRQTRAWMRARLAKILAGSRW